MSKKEVNLLHRFAKFVKASQGTVEAFLENEMISKTRSGEQNRYYWGVMLPAILFHCPESIGVKTTDELHRLLKFSFCYRCREDLFQLSYVKLSDGSAVQALYPFSFSFDTLSHDDANEFLTFTKQWCIEKVGVDLDEIIIEKSKEMS